MLTGLAGHTVEGRYIFASDLHYRWWITTGPGKGLRSKALYYLCDGNAHDCEHKEGRAALIHMERFRPIGTQEINQKTPSWAFNRACKADTEPYFQAWLNDRPAAGGAGGDLPWLPSQEEEESSSDDESSSTEEAEDLKTKVGRLREKLKKAERAEKKLKEKEAAEKARLRAKALKDAGKKKKKKADREKSEDTREPKKKKEKKEKKRKHSPDPDEKKKKKKKKRKGDDCSDSSSSHRLFGVREEESDDAAAKSKRKKQDRGPFGTGSAEKFKDLASEDDLDTDKTVFRDAPTQSQAVNQLKLEEYHQQHPGRLAARLLMKMSRETALNSVGAAYIRESRTPPAAFHYFQTMMVPGLGQKLNIRTARELRTLCVILDCLARDQPAYGADILRQRIKALEKSAQDGTWMAAQYLELINPEQATLLDRAEQVYLAKEVALESKVKGFTGRGTEYKGKGDQKGAKGKGPKG